MKINGYRITEITKIRFEHMTKVFNLNNLYSNIKLSI